MEEPWVSTNAFLPLSCYLRHFATVMESYFSCIIHIFVIHSLVQLYIYFFSFYLLHQLTYTSSFSFGGSVYMCKYGGQRITSSVFSVVPIFFCETGLLVFNLELMMWSGWLASEPQGASCFNLSNTRTQQDNSICTQVVEAQQVIMPTQQGLDSCEFTSHVGLHNPCANAEVRIFNCRVAWFPSILSNFTSHFLACHCEAPCW